MSAYTPNSYRVTLFDRFGAKLRTLPANSFTDGEAAGIQALNRAEAHSFTVSRVLYNSLAPNNERYATKPP